MGGSRQSACVAVTRSVGQGEAFRSPGTGLTTVPSVGYGRRSNTSTTSRIAIHQVSCQSITCRRRPNT